MDAGKYERMRARSTALARQVSATLRKAGYAKTGRYHPFAPFDRGYCISDPSNGTTDEPKVWCSNNAKQESDKRILIGSYEDVLLKSGRFSVTRKGDTLVVRRIPK